MSVELTGLLTHLRLREASGVSVEPSTKLQITQAIAAHGAWKFRLAAAVASGSHDQDLTVVAKDDRCTFGAWLRDTAAEPGQEELHRASKALHADFHRQAASVLAKVDSKNLDSARGDIAIGGDFFEASRQLTETMIGWKRSIQD
jgi:hypothetical protein